MCGNSDFSPFFLHAADRLPERDAGEEGGGRRDLLPLPDGSRAGDVLRCRGRLRTAGQARQDPQARAGELVHLPDETFMSPDYRFT